MNHPPTYVRTFSLHKIREYCYFLDHPPTPMSLRNIKMAPYFMIKFIYSETASQFYKIFPLLLTVCTVVKSKWKISQNFAAFSEYMNFNAINSNSKTLTPFVVIEIDSCFFVCVFSGSQVFDPRFQ